MLSNSFQVKWDNPAAVAVAFIAVSLQGRERLNIIHYFLGHCSERMFPPHFSRTHFSIGVEHDFKNFFTKANKAYTEDNVLVYNVVVYSIPIQLTENDVRNYFSKFGKVLDVKLATYKTKSRRTAFKKAFVKFAEPESACSVLQNNNHRLHDSRITVTAGDSWEQPNADKVCGPNRIEYDVASNSKGMHMLSLHDYCIEAIFGYLNLKAKVRFARVCERFQDIFQTYYRRQSINFDLSNIRDMTLWEMLDFFRLAGGNIASITGTVPYKNRQRIVKYIGESCDQLKRIRLRDTDLRIACLDEFLSGYPQLKELALRKCSLNDNFIKTVTHLNRLETLDLSENKELTGKFIKELVQLRGLSLFSCSNIQTSNLEDICKSLTNLTSLDIRLAGRISGTIFDTMLEHCKQLEILKMCCHESPYERVALLPRLKQLDLLWCSLWSRAQKTLLAELVAHKANQLEVLKIIAIEKLRRAHFALISELRQLKTLFIPCSPLIDDDALSNFCRLHQLEELTIEGCSNVSNNALLELVKSCPRLCFLDIQFCKGITAEFPLETTRFLKSSEKRNKTLVLLAHGTAMEDYDDTAYNELKEAAEQSLIRVIFDFSITDDDW